MSVVIRIHGPLAAATAIALVIVSMGLAAPARAVGCLNEQIREESAYALRLPDCRAYEQVSPINKNFADAVGILGLAQSSLSGDGMTFFSVLPFPGTPGAAEFPTYLSTRSDEGWSTQGLLPPSDPGTFPRVLGVTEDLSKTIVSTIEPPLAPDATPGFSYEYVRDNVTGSYRLLAGPGGEARFADSTPDGSRILFEDETAALPGVSNLYEWDNGQVSLVGLLGDGKAPKNGVAAGAKERTYQQNTISVDGSRVFFTDLETGQIYVRENKTVSVQVSAPQRSAPEEEQPAYWRAATPDGRYVLFTSEAKLTNESVASAGRPDLYRFDVDQGELIDLTTEAPSGANVLGTVGFSNDGSYVYFVATGILASGASEGQANLYEWHDGVTTFIAGLSVEGDEANWRDHVELGEGGGPAEGGKSSRVTPDGTTVLFSSVTQLRPSYNNMSHSELYLFNSRLPVSLNNPICVSCNPNGNSATSNAYLVHLGISPPGPVSRNAFLTGNLSNDGSRIFFETAESLVQQDTNGVMDVYEWENGEVHLISTGQSSSESNFGDASPDGSNVFFFTRQSLVSQDQDDNVDVYDARKEGGIPAQNPSPSSEPCAGEECRGASGSLPMLSTPSSVTLSGAGNLAPNLKITSKPVQHKSKSKKPKRKIKHKKRKRSIKGKRSTTLHNKISRRHRS